MKSLSILFTAALFLFLGNCLVIPPDDTVAYDLEDLDDSLDIPDLDIPDIGLLPPIEQRELQDRAIRPKFTFHNFPRSGTCAKHTYSAGNIRDAGDQAGKLHTRGKQLTKNKYPHVFNNHERDIKNFSHKCKGHLYEFPILQNKKVLVTNSADPGPDRVVVSVSNKNKKTGRVDITFCGLMTHTGAKTKSRFTQCHWK